MSVSELYQSEDGSLNIEIHVKDDSLWLTQEQMADLFGTKRPAITKHLGNIFKSDELATEKLYFVHCH